MAMTNADFEALTIRLFGPDPITPYLLVFGSIVGVMQVFSLVNGYNSLILSIFSWLFGGVFVWRYLLVALRIEPLHNNKYNNEGRDGEDLPTPKYKKPLKPSKEGKKGRKEVNRGNPEWGKDKIIDFAF